MEVIPKVQYKSNSHTNHNYGFAQSNLGL